MEINECYIRYVSPALRFGVTIALNGQRLSLMGDYIGSSGQISGELRALAEKRPDNLKFSVTDTIKLCDIWDRWHLNDMRAGTPKQEAAIRELRRTKPKRYSYDEACDYLREIGLLVDDGYKYGSSWLTEEVPQDVLKWLFSLPGKGHSFDDIYSPEISEQAFLDALLV